MFIIDLLENDDFLYRFMGSAIDQHLGASLTGRTFSDYRSGRVLQILMQFFLKVVKQPQMGILITQLDSETHEWVVYTRAALPIADDHQTPNKVIGLLLMQQSPDALLPAQKLLLAEKEQDGLVKSYYGTL